MWLVTSKNSLISTEACKFSPLGMQHTHFVASIASLHSKQGAGASVRVPVEPARVVELSITTGAMAEKDKGSNKNLCKKKAPKALGISKKSKGSSNKPRPTELLRTALRKVIAGIANSRHCMCNTYLVHSELAIGP